MIKTYSEAVDAAEDFVSILTEMDRALCRHGGHPDQAWWITDKALFERLIQVQKAVLSLRDDLLEKKLKEEKEGENDKSGRI